MSLQDKRVILRKVQCNPKVNGELKLVPVLIPELLAIPYISSVNKKKRLKFAEKYFLKDGSFWKTVIFCDESKFNLFGSDGKVKVWRKSSTEFNEKDVDVNIIQVCFAALGVGALPFIEGKNKDNKDKDYIKILKENLRQSDEKL
ncbi:uncharacterized protein LOC119652164 [Hermetia illucens]|uniref:uncharacterized protein LOC119652164 n=1 Tax=Hermetia illucens TaxID=343691 RepID=UPI0018CC2F59|nr:uncharacterized protein LOC119652164 [Hermetia illucens]